MAGHDYRNRNVERLRSCSVLADGLPLTIFEQISTIDIQYSTISMHRAQRTLPVFSFAVLVAMANRL